MGDISNQIVNIWRESNFSKFSNVLNCNNQSELIHEEVRRDLCFCPELDFDQDSFDGDRRIYERYMDMKRRSRLVEEEDSRSSSGSDSDSYEQGTYSGRILTVTSRKDKSVGNELQQGTIMRNTKIDEQFDTYSSRDKFNNPETIDERLDALVGNVLGGSDDDSLDKMMKQLDLDKNKAIPINDNILRKEDMNKTMEPAMPSRTQSGSLPWDESSQEENDMPDDEKGFQFPPRRRSKIIDDAIKLMQDREKTEVTKYDPLKIVRTASEESF